MEQLNKKLDDILEHVTQVRITQAEQSLVLQRNTEDLERHIKRTDALEDRQEIFEKKMEDIAFPARALKYVLVGLVAIAAAGTTVYGFIQLFFG